ncbi:hypothetical protein CUT44_19465 [Streptomyces carminius]|uniref:Uncharacterized protein n=1 Tax=Streptomyces carminius TaxID=2665496 RepID=A0A2M8LVL4_9ACTN|nr:hypothetical protein [Streptomyces carminius]PJE95985.1 hypothetical protein CUT44_19465 [Streptomyces carminius]
MQWFALDMLAMLAVDSARPDEALRIADELLSRSRVPPRVALLARMRRGRALAAMGDGRRALASLGAARSGLLESVGPRDPAWTWWADEREVTGHLGQALIDLGDPGKAVPHLRYAHARALDQQSGEEGRSAMHYRVELLRGCTAVRAWAEVEEELQALSPLLGTIGSGRNRRMLRGALRSLARTSGVPSRISALAAETARAAAG